MHQGEWCMFWWLPGVYDDWIVQGKFIQNAPPRGGCRSVYKR